jgi:DNA-directed RNA polymerase subunit RPC12/RpoP
MSGTKIKIPGTTGWHYFWSTDKKSWKPLFVSERMGELGAVDYYTRKQLWYPVKDDHWQQRGEWGPLVPEPGIVADLKSVLSGMENIQLKVKAVSAKVKEKLAEPNEDFAQSGRCLEGNHEWYTKNAAKGSLICRRCGKETESHALIEDISTGELRCTVCGRVWNRTDLMTGESVKEDCMGPPTDKPHNLIEDDNAVKCVDCGKRWTLGYIRVNAKIPDDCTGSRG